MIVEIKLTHAVPESGTNGRASGFYSVTLNGRRTLTIQGNAFGSCGINILFGWGQCYGDFSKEDVEDLLKALKEFKDTSSPSLQKWYAKRFLIQVTQYQVDYSHLLMEMLPQCQLLSSYTNHAHASDTQYVYMLDLGK